MANQTLLSEKDIIENGTTSSNQSTGYQYPNDFLPVLKIINYCVFALILIVFVYGVTSWCLIKKFRHFRNYVILSAITANVLRYTLTIISYVSDDKVTHILLKLLSLCAFLYSVLAYNYWLLVLCYIFYSDFVKVFNQNISKRYLKSSLFSWGTPLVSVVVYFLSFVFHYVVNSRDKITYRNFIVAMLMMLLPLAINLVIYVLVLMSLFRNTNTEVSSKQKRLRFYVSTLIFVLSNTVILFTGFLQLLQLGYVIFDILGDSVEYINMIALTLYLPVVKSNRDLWREFVVKKSKQKSVEMK